MRQVLSTALVALIVGALAGVTASTFAQSPDEQTRTVEPAAVSNINAHRVDGKHAVGFTNKRLARRNKLVATNKQGFLPSNIVKPLWGTIKHKPAGFADGIDNEGVTNISVTQVSHGEIVPGTTGWVYATCPAGSVVVGGGHAKGTSLLYDVIVSRATDDRTWGLYITNQYGSSVGVTAYAMCLTVEPGATVATVRTGTRVTAKSPDGK